MLLGDTFDFCLATAIAMSPLKVSVLAAGGGVVLRSLGGGGFDLGGGEQGYWWD